MRANESVCTDVGCSLEQDVLMTETMAHRTASSRRGLRRLGDPSPAKHQHAVRLTVRRACRSDRELGFESGLRGIR